MTSCIHLTDTCQIVQKLIGPDCPSIKPHPEACKVCTEDKYNPRDENFVTVNLAMTQCRKCKECNVRGELIQRNEDNLIKYNKNYTSKPLELGEGCGTELHKLYKKMGFSITSSCDCLRIIKLMNKWTVEECRENVDEIVTMTKNSAKLHSWVGRMVELITPSSFIRDITLRAIDSYEKVLQEER